MQGALPGPASIPKETPGSQGWPKKEPGCPPAGTFPQSTAAWHGTGVPPQTWPGLGCSRELSHLLNATHIPISTRFCCLQPTATHFCLAPGHLGFTGARTASTSKLQHEPSSFRHQLPSQMKQALCRTQEKESQGTKDVI